MAECITRLEKDIIFDCSNIPVAGIEKEILLINREDIDWAGTTITDNVITSLILKDSKKAFLLKALNDSHFTLSSKPIIDKEGINGHKHSLGFRVYANDADAGKQIDALVQGASLVAVVENKAKGTSQKSAFDVLGLQVGLEVSSDSGGRDYKANDGVYMLSFATPDGQKEPRNVMKWLETDYQTTKEKFDNKLAS